MAMLTLEDVVGKPAVAEPAQAEAGAEKAPTRILSLEDVVGPREAKGPSILERAKSTAGSALDAIGLGALGGKRLPSFEGVLAESSSTAETVGKKQSPYVPEGTRVARAATAGMPGVAPVDEQKVIQRGVAAFGSAEDMMVGMVSGLLLTPYQLLREGKLKRDGMSGPDAAAAAEKDVHAILERMPQAALKPFETIAKSLGKEDEFKDNPVEWIMGKLSSGIQSGSEQAGNATGIPPEHFRLGANFAMNLTGAAGVRTSLTKAAQLRVAEAAKPSARVEDLRKAGVNAEVLGLIENFEATLPKTPDLAKVIEKPGAPSEARAAAIEAKRAEATARAEIEVPRAQAFSERLVRDADQRAEARRMAAPAEQARIAVEESKQRIAEEQAQRWAQAEEDARAALTPSQLGAKAEAPAEGKVRYYHGGNPEGVKGPLWFTSDLRDATGWASREQSMRLWYVDVPKNDPIRGGDAQYGVLPPPRIEFPAKIAAQRQLLKGPSSKLTPVESAIAKARKLDQEAPVSTNELYAQRVADKAASGAELAPHEASVLRTVAEEVKMPKGEKGTIDPELLRNLAIAASAAAISAPLLQAAWNHFNPDNQVSLKQFLETGDPRKVPPVEDRDITPRNNGTQDTMRAVPPPEEPPYRPFTPPRKGDEILVDAGLGLAVAAGVVGARKGKVGELLAKADPVQRGSADPARVGAIGLASAGAVIGGMLDSDNRLAGAALGAAGVLGFAKLARDGHLRALDETLGMVSTRIGQMSEPVLLGLRRYTRQVGERTDAALDVATPLLKGIQKLDKESRAEINLAILGEKDAAVTAKKFGLGDEWSAVRALLDVYKEKQKALGRFAEGLVDYFPRIVADVEGLKKAIGTQHATGIEKVLAAATREKALKVGPEGDGALSPVEQSIVINNYLQSPQVRSSLPSHARARGVETVTPELAKFYETPTESLLRYIRAATEDIAKAEFFGKNLKSKKVEGRLATDVDASIGAMMDAELRTGHLAAANFPEMKGMLKSIFENAEKAPGGFIQDVRNATNAGLLGSFHSAATQAGDSMMTVYHHGLMPTLSAVKAKLTGNAAVFTKDFGLTNHIMEELGKTRLSGKTLQTVLKLNGFRAVDQFAKNLNLNAGLIKNAELAKTEVGRAALEGRWGRAFGEETGPLLKDLQEGRLTERVKDLLYSELSNAQPINKLEVPQAFLDHPNGRIVYSMSTYMLKQFDVIRRDAYQEIAKGNWQKGYRNLAGAAGALALSNLPGDIIKDWLSGRDFKLADYNFAESLLKNFGFNRYALDKLQRGDFTLAHPTLSLGGSIVRDPLVTKHLPGPGRAYYDRYQGGNDSVLLRQTMQKRKAEREREERLDPGLKAERLLRESLRRERAIERAREGE